MDGEVSFSDGFNGLFSNCIHISLYIMKMCVCPSGERF